MNKQEIIIAAGIFATNESRPRELIPTGTHVARAYKMIHIGTLEEEFQGEKKMVNKVLIGWELADELRTFKEEKGPQPMSIDKVYTLSMNEKANLRKDLQAWRGLPFSDAEAKSFDVTKLIGAPCLLSIIHKPKASKPGEFREDISSISPLMKGQVCPSQINPSQVLTYSDWNPGIFDSLPDWLKDDMKSSLEYKALMYEPTSSQEQHIPDNQDIGNNLPF